MTSVDVYTKDDCAYCMMTKTALAKHAVQFNEYKLHRDFSKEHIQEKFPGAKSFPIIVVDGFFIGGYNQLSSYLEEQTRSAKTLLNE